MLLGLSFFECHLEFVRKSGCCLEKGDPNDQATKAASFFKNPPKFVSSSQLQNMHLNLFHVSIYSCSDRFMRATHFFGNPQLAMETQAGHDNHREILISFSFSLLHGD